MTAILQKCVNLILIKKSSPADLNGAVASAGLLVCLQMGTEMCHTEANVPNPHSKLPEGKTHISGMSASKLSPFSFGGYIVK